MATKTTRIALAIGALAIICGAAQAAPLDQVRIESPVVKVIARDPATNAPIEQVTVTARVIPEPDTLTLDSGVVLLNDYIREAAHKVCFEADPMNPDNGRCYRDAMKSAKPQVAALVAHAKAGKAADVAS